MATTWRIPTAAAFLQRLQAGESQLSWSGTKRVYDNIQLKRMWRAIKHEELYPQAYSNGREAEIRLAQVLWRCCHRSPHSSLEKRTPHEVDPHLHPVP
jgi:putative transposase